THQTPVFSATGAAHVRYAYLLEPSRTLLSSPRGSQIRLSPNTFPRLRPRGGVAGISRRKISRRTATSSSPSAGRSFGGAKWRRCFSCSGFFWGFAQAKIAGDHSQKWNACRRHLSRCVDGAAWSSCAPQHAEISRLLASGRVFQSRALHLAAIEK